MCLAFYIKNIYQKYCSMGLFAFTFFLQITRLFFSLFQVQRLWRLLKGIRPFMTLNNLKKTKKKEKKGKGKGAEKPRKGSKPQK